MYEMPSNIHKSSYEMDKLSHEADKMSREMS
jgi:hypothetical protein